MFATTTPWQGVRHGRVSCSRIHPGATRRCGAADARSFVRPPVGAGLRTGAPVQCLSHTIVRDTRPCLGRHRRGTAAPRGRAACPDHDSEGEQGLHRPNDRSPPHAERQRARHSAGSGVDLGRHPFGGLRQRDPHGSWRTRHTLQPRDHGAAPDPGRGRRDLPGTAPLSHAGRRTVVPDCESEARRIPRWHDLGRP